MNSSGQLGSGLEGCSPDVGTRMVCLSPPQTEGEASPESGGWLPIWGLLVFGPGSIKCVYGIHFCVSPKRVCVCLFVYVYMSPSPSLLEHLRLPQVWGPISPWHIPCQWLLPPSAGALVLLGIWVWMLGSVLACSWWLLGGTWAPWICLLLVGVGVSLGLGLGLLRCSQWSLWACRCSHLGRLHCGCWVTPPRALLCSSLSGNCGCPCGGPPGALTLWRASTFLGPRSTASGPGGWGWAPDTHY